MTNSREPVMAAAAHHLARKRTHGLLIAGACGVCALASETGPSSQTIGTQSTVTGAIQTLAQRLQILERQVAEDVPATRHAIRSSGKGA